MARPQRCRRICGMPQVSSFCPAQQQGQQPILLSLDEYEVIRLVDLEEKSHQQCALQMDISRSTVQEIYESARKKIAACLVHGRELVISGGIIGLRGTGSGPVRPVLPDGAGRIPERSQNKQKARRSYDENCSYL